MKTDKPKRITRKQLEEDTKLFGGYSAELAREALMLMDELDAEKADHAVTREQLVVCRAQRDEARAKIDAMNIGIGENGTMIRYLRRNLCEAEDNYRDQRDIIATLRRENEALRELEVLVRKGITVRAMPNTYAHTLDAIDAMRKGGGGGGETRGQDSQETRAGTECASGTPPLSRTILPKVEAVESITVCVRCGNRVEPCPHCHHDTTGGGGGESREAAKPEEPSQTGTPPPDEPPECPICSKAFFFKRCTECGYPDTNKEASDE